ncbi:MAG: carboxymuconolactone decarboxylase family protein [Haloarculaceae archaeon]
MAATADTQTYEQTRTDVEETLGIVPGFLDSLNEQDLVNEWPNFKRHTVEETVIPAKYKELIELAVAANLRCPYCEHFHMAAAKMHGATDEELAEVAFLASVTARYSAIIHAQNYDMDTFDREVERIGEHLTAQASE